MKLEDIKTQAHQNHCKENQIKARIWYQFELPTSYRAESKETFSVRRP